MPYATWIADELRAAGLTVVEYDGWQTRGHRDWVGGQPSGLTWHHDASARGDSPYSPQDLLNRFNDPRGSAGLWVNRQGVWHVIAAGPAWHAGNVLPGKKGNYEAIGVETDHTTGEDWPAAQLNGLRTGSRVLLRRMGQGSDGLDFHKTICDPPGRKVDPDGLDLATERAALDRATAPVLPVFYPVAPQQYRSENGDGLLELWETGPAIADLQRQLGIRADGMFGPVTQQAVRDYQSSHGLAVDGIAGPQTLGHLHGGSPAPPPAPAAGHPAYPGRLLTQGVRGDDVRVWQQRMRDRGWTIDVDGAYGPQSADVARRFQAEKGLSVDGVVGPQTWDAAFTAPVT